MLYAIKMLLRQTAFLVKPASGRAKDRQAAEFVKSWRISSYWAGREYIARMERA